MATIYGGPIGDKSSDLPDAANLVPNLRSNLSHKNTDAPIPSPASPRWASDAAPRHYSPMFFLPPSPTTGISCANRHGALARGDVGHLKQRQSFDPSNAAGYWLFQPLTGALSIPPTRTWFGKKVIVAELGPNVFPFTAIFLTLNPWVPLHMHICGHILHLLGFSSFYSDETA
jgi:hypothetical protein